MTPSLDELGIADLSVDEILELAHLLQESAAKDIENSPLTDAQKAELDRRLALWDADPNRGIPMDEVFDELDKKYGW